MNGGAVTGTRVPRPQLLDLNPLVNGGVYSARIPEILPTSTVCGGGSHHCRFWETASGIQAMLSRARPDHKRGQRITEDHSK